MLKRIVDVFYEKFFTVEIDGHKVGVLLSEDGTLYNIKPCTSDELEYNSQKMLGMSDDEIKTFLENQPDFPKPIATHHRKWDTRNGHPEDETVYNNVHLPQNSFLSP